MLITTDILITSSHDTASVISLSERGSFLLWIVLYNLIIVSASVRPFRIFVRMRMSTFCGLSVSWSLVLLINVWNVVLLCKQQSVHDICTVFYFYGKNFFEKYAIGSQKPFNSYWSTASQATLDASVINGLLSFGWASSTAFANEYSHNLNEFVCSVQLMGLSYFFFAPFNNPVRGACAAGAFYGVVFVGGW